MKRKAPNPKVMVRKREAPRHKKKEERKISSINCNSSNSFSRNSNRHFQLLIATLLKLLLLLITLSVTPRQSILLCQRSPMNSILRRKSNYGTLKKLTGRRKGRKLKAPNSSMSPFSLIKTISQPYFNNKRMSMLKAHPWRHTKIRMLNLLQVKNL
jgi:hypothetical protein